MSRVAGDPRGLKRVTSFHVYEEHRLEAHVLRSGPDCIFVVPGGLGARRAWKLVLPGGMGGTLLAPPHGPSTAPHTCQAVPDVRGVYFRHRRLTLHFPELPTRKHRVSNLHPGCVLDLTH